MPPYAGNGKATLINAGGIPKYAWYNERATSGIKSLGFQLERQKSAHYPAGAAFQVTFNADPGAFTVEIQGSDDDTDATYVQIGTITAVNASNVGRWDMAGSNGRFPLFVRYALTAITNDVYVTGLISR